MKGYAKDQTSQVVGLLETACRVTIRKFGILVSQLTFSVKQHIPAYVQETVKLDEKYL